MKKMKNNKLYLCFKHNWSNSTTICSSCSNSKYSAIITNGKEEGYGLTNTVVQLNKDFITSIYSQKVKVSTSMITSVVVGNKKLLKKAFT